MSQGRHRISAGALVEHEGRLLLVHLYRPGHYDFWVAPGGGVNGQESLQAAAVREVREESGLDVEVTKLLYIDELFNANCRFVKFWFAGRLVGGSLDVSHPEARAETIVEAAWLGPEELRDRQVFPSPLAGRYWSDRAKGFPAPVHLPLQRMA